MKTLVAVTACAGVLALSGGSQAAQISSPTIFGSGTQDRADCVVLNGGTTTLTVTVKLLDEYGGTVRDIYLRRTAGPGAVLRAQQGHRSRGGLCLYRHGELGHEPARRALVIEEELQDPVFGDTFLRAIRSAPLR